MEFSCLCNLPDLLDLLTIDGGFAKAYLESVVLWRVVASCNLDAAVHIKIMKGEVKEGCGHHAQIQDINAGL